MWLEVTEFYLKVNNCQSEDLTSLLLLLCDKNSFEAATYIGIKPNTLSPETKLNLKDYIDITETKVELRKQLYLRQQKTGQSIKTNAQDIKLIGQKAYLDGEPPFLEYLLINVFINGLRDNTFRARVLLYKPKTLIDATQYPQFFKSADHVAQA